MPSKYTPETVTTILLALREGCTRKGSAGIAELEMTDGHMEWMYVYPNAEGKLPKGPSIDRQLCVYGEIAKNKPETQFVYRNTCTGAFRFDGLVFYPRADVLKDGVCARNGACITK